MEHRSATGVLNNMLTRINTVHNVALIAAPQTDKLHVHFCNLQITSKVIRHIGVSLWDNLPPGY